MTTTFPSHLTDDALVAEVQRLAGDARAATAKLIAHLAVLDERSLYLKAGFNSLFVYCLQILRLSEHATYNRIEAMRAARAFPVILDRLADGSVNLTTVRLLAPHLTPENHARLLGESAHKRTEEVKEPIAANTPRPDVAPSVRKLPESPRPGPGRPPSPEPRASSADSKPLFEVDERPRPSVVTPLSPDRYEFRFTGRRSTRDKLRYAQDLLRRSLPSGDPGEIFDQSLTLLIESLERKKFAATKTPCANRATGRHSRHIPAKVRRAVWRRDDGRCAFIGNGGRRCDARSFLEFHHRRPHAAVGPATVENVSLRCAAHNRYEAEVFFGPIWHARGEGLVEETRETYGLSAGRSTRFQTSSLARGLTTANTGPA